MKLKKITIEDLALMVQAGFSGAETSVSKRFNKIEVEMAEGFKEIKADIKGLHQDHENIDLKLTNVAYRFELVELQKRVELLEKRVLKN